MEVFQILDHLRPTATGLDDLPAWFLHLAAPILAAPLAELFNQSLAEGIVPRQWKTWVITPIPKVSKPVNPSDFRPISVTPILSRVLERFIVQQYIYTAFHHQPPGLDFIDQFAFRPSGSTTATLVALFHRVRTMLLTNQFVHVYCFDFSKASDTVRHYTLMDKMAQMQLTDNVYKWIIDFFWRPLSLHKVFSEVSAVAEVKASVIQGSGLGPASFTV